MSAPPQKGRDPAVPIIGCVVNGPSEALMTDIGVAGGGGA